MKVDTVQSYTNTLDTSTAGTSKSYYKKTKAYPNDTTSFGSIADKAKDGTSKLFQWIDRKGFFVEFLIVDTVSMILPRVLVGLNRDKDKTGEYNYKAAAEEAGREITSGPTMNLIPMGILAAVCAKYPTANMDKNTIKAFSNAINNVIDKNPKINTDNPNRLHKLLANQLFEDAFSGHKFENPAEAKAYRAKFITSLSESANLTNNLFNKNEEFQSQKNAFEQLIKKINNKGLEQPLDTSAISLKSTGAQMRGSALFEDFNSYSKDILSKMTKQIDANTTADSAKSIIKNLENKRFGLKLLTAISAFFAVGGFLLCLPKLYQQGGLSPAEESAKRAQAQSGGAND